MNRDYEVKFQSNHFSCGIEVKKGMQGGPMLVCFS